MKKKLPVEIENFAELRNEVFYFVDKTGMIRDLLNAWGEVNLVYTSQALREDPEYEYAEVLF